MTAPVCLSIIIVNWNTRNLLAACLESIHRHPPTPAYDVWVVDNGSTDNSVAMVKADYAWVNVIVNTSNVGFARANNQAILASTGDFVLMLNSDTEVQQDSVTFLLNLAAAHPSIGVVGPMLHNNDRSLQPSWAKFPTLLSELMGTHVRERRSVQYEVNGMRASEVDWVGGACMLIRRKVFDMVGLLDESMFMYSEETDLCLRSRKAGWQVIYLEDSHVIHLGGGSSGGVNTKQMMLLYQSKIRFFLKHRGARQAEMLRVGLIALGIVASIGYLIASLFSLAPKRSTRRAMARAKLSVTKDLLRYRVMVPPNIGRR